MKNPPIPTDHYYVPSGENDPVQAEVQRIFKAAIEPFTFDSSTSVQDKRVMMHDILDRMLKESFTSRRAAPSASVELTYVGVNKRPLFLIGAVVYGHPFTATLG